MSAEYEEEYEEEEEEEEEDEFLPDYDEEEEEADDEGEEEQWEGTLSVTDEKKLHWKGSGFDLTSAEPVEVNLLVAGSSEDKKDMIWTGPVEDDGEHDDSSNLKKPPPSMKTFSVTVLSTQEFETVLIGDDDDRDEKKSASSQLYKVYGTEQAKGTDGTKIEFVGSFSTTGSESVPLTCLVRRVPVAASPPKASPSAAAAAAAASRPNNDDEELEEEDVVDANELIALREEAGLSVEEIRKRYSEQTSAGPDTKRGKYEEEGDEDDEADIGF
jgi:hypothetical protein